MYDLKMSDVFNFNYFFIVFSLHSLANQHIS
jgi:hypothetical protein